MPHWPSQTIWWQVYPLGFLGAEPTALPATASPVPRLRQLEPWLDYLVDLGANGLLLGPIFAAESHGYDTTDHFRLDPRLGTVEDLRWLVDACHARQIRLVLDGVFNHVGRSFAPFQEVVAHRQASPFAEWFRIDWAAPAPGLGAEGFSYATFEG